MPYLIVNFQTPQERVCTLKLGANTIGREHDNSLQIEDVDRSLSRYHAEIWVQVDRVTLRDLQSRNHTFVNDLQIDQCELKHGDIIRFGGVACRFVTSLTPTSSTTTPPASASVRTNFSIVKRMAPGEYKTVMQDLLQTDEQRMSMLKLRHSDPSNRAMDKLRILLEVSKQLASPDDLDTLLDKILELLFQIMNVDRAAILITNSETKSLDPRATRFKPNVPADAHFYSRQITQFVLQHGEGILTTDAQIDKRFDSSKSILQHSIHASMCVPLNSRDEVIGVLYVDNLSLTNIYSEEDLEFLVGLASQAAVAISKAYLYEKARTEAVMRAKLERFFPKAVTKKIREEGELRIVETEVTALFSDITGFTELASHMEPHEVLEMLNEYFSIMVEDIVFRHGGTLEKYIADALLAVWGSPYPHDNDVRQAVRAAIEMQQAMRRINQQWQKQRDLQIQIHIGLNTGRVAAGNIGSKQLIQYTHIGDTMNVASRICSAAKAGEILISQTTLDRLGAMTFPVEQLDPVQVKGKAEPLQLYRVRWDQVPVSTQSINP